MAGRAEGEDEKASKPPNPSKMQTTLILAKAAAVRFSATPALERMDTFSGRIGLHGL